MSKRIGPFRFASWGGAQEGVKFGGRTVGWYGLAFSIITRRRIFNIETTYEKRPS